MTRDRKRGLNSCNPSPVTTCPQRDKKNPSGKMKSRSSPSMNRKLLLSILTKRKKRNPVSGEFFSSAQNVTVHGGTFTIQQGQDTNASQASGQAGITPGIQLQHESFNEPVFPQNRSSAVVYWDNLLMLGRGSPIWLPEPTSNNEWFRRYGVTIGDVGLLLPTGGFLFLFNICYPREHAINAGGVPDDFAPLEHPVDPSFLTRTSERPGYSLTSRSVDRIGTNLDFQSCGDQGAILALPSGLNSEDLFATQDFCDYIAQHVTSWYRYIIHHRRCRITNGDIRVVTGFSKTSQWGVAAFSESSRPIQLSLRPDTSSEYAYVWDYSGSCDTRSGPRAAETNSASANNQCVFLRTLNATFSPEAWLKLQQNNFKQHSNILQDIAFPENVPIMGNGTQCVLTCHQFFSGQQCNYRTSANIISNVSSSMMRHPSKALNDALWKNAQKTRVTSGIIITTDSDWISVLQPNDSEIPDALEMHNRLVKLGAVITSDKGYITLRLPATPAIDPIFPSCHSCHHDDHHNPFKRLLAQIAPAAFGQLTEYNGALECHPGTRVEVLNQITQWAFTKEERGNRSLMWLSGGAGTGKTTIANTIANRLMKTPHLALSSFYFPSKFDCTRNSTASLAPTIAYQLCTRSPILCKSISSAIDNDQSIFTRSLTTQFRTLIVDPLHDFATTGLLTSPAVIVIDGLDEFVDQGPLPELVYLLTTSVTELQMEARVLVSSRPNSTIGDILTALASRNKVSQLPLELFYPATDIKRYLEDNLARLQVKYKPAGTWPSGNVEFFNTVFNKSSGMFIYAATAIDYLDSESACLGPYAKRLEKLLSIQPSIARSEFKELDSLYSCILLGVENVETVLSTVGFSCHYPDFSFDQIQRVLGIDVKIMEDVLPQLGGLVKLRPSDGGTTMMFHSSFADYLLDYNRSQDLFTYPGQDRSQYLTRYLHTLSDATYSACLPRDASVYSRVSRLLFIPDETVMTSELLSAVEEFPISEFCTLLVGSQNPDTIKTFLNVLYDCLSWIRCLGHKPKFFKIYSHHINCLINFVISQFTSRYFENYQANFLFCCRYLVPGSTCIDSRCMASNDIQVILSAGLPDDIDSDIRSHFSVAVDDGRWQDICARGAMYCLSRLCDHRSYRQTFSDPNLDVKNAARRRETPWKWRRTMNLLSHQSLSGSPLITESSTANNAYVVATISDVHRERKLPANYLCLLQYLAYFLPKSSPYEPLIDACHSKTFAPMSRVFPRASRRARREMSLYLSRNRGSAITL